MCGIIDLIGIFTKIKICTECHVDFESQNGIGTGGTRTWNLNPHSINTHHRGTSLTHRMKLHNNLRITRKMTDWQTETRSTSGVRGFLLTDCIFSMASWPVRVFVEMNSKESREICRIFLTKNSIQTWFLLCEKPGWYHSTSETQVTEDL